MSDFATLLSEFRMQRRLSQSRLAEAAGFDHSYVSRLESGSRDPSRDAVERLADALDLPPLDRDQLRIAANCAPADITAYLADAPRELRAVIQLVTGADLSDDRRAGLVAALGGLVTAFASP